MQHFATVLLATLATLATPSAQSPAPNDDSVRVVVQAQPGDLVLLLLGPGLTTPTLLPGFEGLLALDPTVMVVVPARRPNALGVSTTILHDVWPHDWAGLWLQPAIVSPRDPASGQLRPPRRLRP